MAYFQFCLLSIRVCESCLTLDFTPVNMLSTLAATCRKNGKKLLHKSFGYAAFLFKSACLAARIVLSTVLTLVHHNLVVVKNFKSNASCM